MCASDFLRRLFRRLRLRHRPSSRPQSTRAGFRREFASCKTDLPGKSSTRTWRFIREFGIDEYISTESEGGAHEACAASLRAHGYWSGRGIRGDLAGDGLAAWAATSGWLLVRRTGSRLDAGVGLHRSEERRVR